MDITIIVAAAKNNAIGKNNRLLWHLPADLKRFKKITLGHTVVMGRKTYDSIGKPLSGRRNIVLSRTLSSIPGCIVVNSLEEAFVQGQGEQLFVLGGAEIYAQALPLSKRIYLTRVHQNFDGDSFFPKLSSKEWQETSKSDFQSHNKHTLAYSYIVLDRC